MSGAHIPPIHLYTAHDARAHEKTRKRAKANKLSGVRKLWKLLVRKTISKIVKKNGKKTKRQNKIHDTKPNVFKLKCRRKSGRKAQKTARNGQLPKAQKPATKQ